MRFWMLYELHNHCCVQWWKNFENQSTFAESSVPPVFWLTGQYVAFASLVSETRSYNKFFVNIKHVLDLHERIIPCVCVCVCVCECVGVCICVTSASSEMYAAESICCKWKPHAHKNTPDLHRLLPSYSTTKQRYYATVIVNGCLLAITACPNDSSHPCRPMNAAPSVCLSVCLSVCN